MKCITSGCDKEFISRGMTFTTLVGYGGDRDGHRHDDNCIKRTYRCASGHDHVLSIRRTCPKEGCTWQGKPNCFCHPGEKMTTWPKGDIQIIKGLM